MDSRYCSVSQHTHTALKNVDTRSVACVGRAQKTLKKNKNLILQAIEYNSIETERRYEQHILIHKKSNIRQQTTVWYLPRSRLSKKRTQTLMIHILRERRIHNSDSCEVRYKCQPCKRDISKTKERLKVDGPSFCYSTSGRASGGRRVVIERRLTYYEHIISTFA